MAATIETVDGKVKIRSLATAATGSLTEGFCGAIAVLTALVGLAGAAPLPFACATSILLGCGLLLEGGALSGLASFFASDADLEAKVGSVTGAEFFGGWTGLICGVLASFGTSPQALLPVASMVFGGALMMGSAAFSPIDRLPVPLRAYRRPDNVVMAAGAEVVGGLAALILGMLSLVHWANVNQMTLVLVGFLCAAIAVLMGGAVASRRIRLGFTG